MSTIFIGKSESLTLITSDSNMCQRINGENQIESSQTGTSIWEFQIGIKRPSAFISYKSELPRMGMEKKMFVILERTEQKIVFETPDFKSRIIIDYRAKGVMIVNAGSDKFLFFSISKMV